MTSQPSLPSSLRGAVDLSGLGQPAPAAGRAGGAGGRGGAAVPATVLVEGTDATLEQLILSTQDVPALVVLWSGGHPETKLAVDNAVAVAEQLDGRIRVIAIDAQANPLAAEAFQVQQVPTTMGVIAAQPVPLFPGVQPVEQVRAVVDQLLQAAAQNGVNGRIPLGEATAEPVEEIDPRLDEAFEALENGDLDAAAAAYEKLLADAPADAEAKAGLGQVRLLQRVQDADLQAARAAAAADPSDIDAQLLVADLDLSGGHVEDAFTRLIDVVRQSADEDRERVRRRLLELFDLVGATDERVVKARRTLMSALF